MQHWLTEFQVQLDIAEVVGRLDVALVGDGDAIHDVPADGAAGRFINPLR